MKWIKATERLPVLPDVLPPDTPDERGVLFVNRTHSAGNFWYPSYGQSTASVMNLQIPGWSLEQWEWLDESVVTQNESVVTQNETFKEIIYRLTIEPNERVVVEQEKSILSQGKILINFFDWYDCKALNEDTLCVWYVKGKRPTDL